MNHRSWGAIVGVNNILFFISLSVLSSCKTDLTPIECLSNYIASNVDENKLKEFLKLEGVYVWREWSDLTSHIAEDYFVLDNCQINEYMDMMGASLDSISGEMILVLSIHSQLKTGSVDHKDIIQTVDSMVD